MIHRIRGQAQGQVARLLGLVALPRETRSGQVHGLDARLLGLVALPQLSIDESGYLHSSNFPNPTLPGVQFNPMNAPPGVRFNQSVNAMSAW